MVHNKMTPSGEGLGLGNFPGCPVFFGAKFQITQLYAIKVAQILGPNLY